MVRISLVRTLAGVLPDGKGTGEFLCRNMAQGEAFSHRWEGECSAFAVAAQILRKTVEAVGRQADG
jgi:hypothetical protein